MFVYIIKYNHNKKIYRNLKPVIFYNILYISNIAHIRFPYFTNINSKYFNFKIIFLNFDQAKLEILTRS